jgi:zinc ribbon protein
MLTVYKLLTPDQEAEMSIELNRLNTGEQVAAGSAIALFVCMFFSWFNFGFETLNAWEALDYISPILTVVIAAVLGIAFMKVTGRSIGDIPSAPLIFSLGCLAALLILYRLIDPVSLSGGEGFEPTSSVQAGLFLALLASAGVAVGGYLASGGTVLNQLKERLPSANQPPPPPAQPAAAPPPPPPPPASTPAESAAAPPAGAFCEECGAPLAPSDRFCSACGKEQSPSPQ